MASASLFGWVLVILTITSGSIVLIATDDLSLDDAKIIPRNIEWEYQNATSDFSAGGGYGLPEWDTLSGNWVPVGNTLECQGTPYGIIDFIIPDDFRPADVVFTSIKLQSPTSTGYKTSVTNTYQIYNPEHEKFRIWLLYTTMPHARYLVKFDTTGTYIVRGDGAIISNTGPSFTDEDTTDIITYFNTDTRDYAVTVNNYEIIRGQEDTVYLNDLEEYDLDGYYGGVGSWSDELVINSISTDAGKIERYQDTGSLSGALFAAGKFDVLGFLGGMVSVLTWGVDGSPISNWMWSNVPSLFIVIFVIIPEIIALFVIMQMVRGN